jgi:hypothetical protein
VTTNPGEIFEDLDRNAKTFTVTDHHLKLLRAACVRWEYTEFGAPAIDGKRPYGNSSVLVDIVQELFPERAIERNVDMDEWDAYSAYADAHEDELVRLHAETGIALQIALSVGEFRSGDYVRQGYGSWAAA